MAKAVIREKEKKVFVCSFYNTDFISKAKELKGRWDGKYWIFKNISIEEIEKIVLNIYHLSRNEIRVVTEKEEQYNKQMVELYKKDIKEAIEKDIEWMADNKPFIIWRRKREWMLENRREWCIENNIY
jgi:hypothetical protein